jgi:hypothetical protein
LWDLVPVETFPIFNSKIPILNKEKAQEYSVSTAEAYKEEILKERERQAEIKRKYGIKSLKYLISELDAHLAELYERGAKGEKVSNVKEKEERKKQYEETLKTLQKEIEQEISLTISMPKFLGVILIKPAASKEMVSDEEIEKIGMEIAMEYEKSQGREPEDVSKENLGFDIRSKGEGEMRYIEVKARKDEGEVVLTPNEWFKAKRFREQYWLYIVANAVNNPTLYIINNPAENLKAEEKVEVVRFVVSLEEWKNKGVMV